MARRLIVGDIHAQFKLLKEVLNKARFDPEEDILYSVGDLCDRGHNAASTLKFLMSLPDFRPVIGNHDLSLEYYLFTGSAEDEWLERDGGRITLNAVKAFFSAGGRDRLRSWLASIPAIRVEADAIIIHGGITASCTEKKLKEMALLKRPAPLLYSHDADGQLLDSLCCDRNYVRSAMCDAGLPANLRIEDFVLPLKTRRTIFVGHTPTEDGRPFFSEKYHLIAIDTGAGGGEKPLTLMDMDTHEYWQAGPNF